MIAVLLVTSVSLETVFPSLFFKINYSELNESENRKLFTGKNSEILLTRAL
jgi:hypothetical protein